MAFLWEEHRTDITSDPHPQYSLIDGTKEYTGSVGYDNGILLTVDNFDVTSTGHTDAVYPSVPLSGGGGFGAIGTVTVSGGIVTAVTVTTGGLGYRVPRGLTIDKDDIGGTGASDVTCNVATVTDNILDASLRGHQFITRSYIERTEASAIVNPVGTGNDGTMGTDGVYYYDLTDEGGGVYSVQFDHNIGVTYPMITVWRNIGPSQGEIVQPLSIESLNSNSIFVKFESNDSFIIRLHGRI